MIAVVRPLHVMMPSRVARSTVGDAPANTGGNLLRPMSRPSGVPVQVAELVIPALASAKSVAGAVPKASPWAGSVLGVRRLSPRPRRSMCRGSASLSSASIPPGSSRPVVRPCEAYPGAGSFLWSRRLSPLGLSLVKPTAGEGPAAGG